MKKPKENCIIGVMLTALGLSTLSNVAAAADITGALKTGVGKSDNLLRTPDDPFDVGIAFIGAEFGYVELTSRVVASIIVNADYMVYDEPLFENELVGGASAFLDYYFVEERLWWNLEYNFGQQIFDPLQPIRPENRENVSFLTTGPEFSLPFGGRNSLDVALNYSTIDYELRENDNHRASGDVGISRDIGEGRTIALIGSEEQVTYDDVVINPDFDRSELFFRWTTLTTRNNVVFDIGYTELAFDDLNQKSSGSVLRLDWTRVVSASTTFTVGGGSRYSDQGDIFRFAQITSFDIRETEDVIGVASPFRNDFFNAFYNLDRERFSVNVMGRWSNEDYEEDNTFDREVARMTLLLSRQLSRKVVGDIGLTYSTRKFDSLDRNDKDLLTQLSIGYEFNSAYTVSLSYQYSSRDSTLETDEFDENRVFLMLSYVPKWSR